MNLESLSGLKYTEVEAEIEGKRLIILAPRHRNRNVLLAYFINNPATYLFTVQADVTPLVTFLGDLSVDLAEFYPEMGTQLSKALQRRTFDPRDAADALAADLAKIGDGLSFIVLEAFDRLEASDASDAFFERLVNKLPDHLTLVINGRNVTYYPWSHLIRAGLAVALADQTTLNGGIFNPVNDEKPQLEVYGFGTGEVFVNGAPVMIWDGPLPRHLFHFFVDHPMITRDEIFGAFWPDLPVKEATNVFHVTKRKISERLGYELTQYAGGFYKPSEQLNIHYDVASFENHYKRGEDSQAAEPSDLATHFQVIRLYRGEFLHNMDAPWIIERRDQLKRKYIEALVQTGRVYQMLQEMERALHYYIRAVREFPLREDIHRAVMTIHIEQREFDKARAQYRLMEEALHRELRVKPSPASIALYKSIGG